MDWFYHEMHVRWAYQLKLRDRGTYGFLLPREHIIPTGKEMVDAIMYFGGFLQEAYAPKTRAATGAEESEGVAGDDAEHDENIEVEASENVEADASLSEENETVVVEHLEPKARQDLRKRR